MDQLIRLSFLHPLLVRSGHVESIGYIYENESKNNKSKFPILQLALRSCNKSVIVGSHIHRLVLATEETMMTQPASHRSINFQCRSWSRRGTKVNGLHHGDSSLLKPTEIQIATKPSPGPPPKTLETFRRENHVLGYELQFLLSGVLPVFHDQNYKLQRRRLMCCLIRRKSSKIIQNVF